MTNIKSRINKWIQHKLAWIPFPKKNLTTSVNHLYKILYSGSRLSLPSFFFNIKDPSLFDIASTRFIYILQKARNLLGTLSLENNEVKKNWWKYLPLLHSLLKHISKNPHTKNLRTFTILPLYSIQQRNINIDTEALYQLWASTKHSDLVTREVFKENFDHWWNRSFNIKKVSTRNRTFTYYLQTDGVSASVHLQRPKKNW